MRIVAKFVYAGVLIALAGCSSLNPFASKTVQRNSPVALVDFKPVLPVVKTWSASIGSAGDYSFSPAFAAGNVFVAAANGVIASLDAISGREKWRINAGMSLTAGIGTDGNTVVVAGQKGAILAFDSEGKLRWKMQASSEILSAPAVGQGLVIVRSIDNRIQAFDVDTGMRRWILQRTAPTLSLRTAPGILIVDSVAYIGLPGGRLLALSLANGGTRWEAAVGDPRGATELERIVDLSGAPVTIGRDVCAVAYQGRVACFDLVSGAPRWNKELSSDVGIAADERFVFASDVHGAVTAYTRDAGLNVWRNYQLANRRLSTPVSYGRAVAVGDGQGYVHFLSRDSGAFLGRASTDGSAIVSTPLVAGSNLIFQTQSGAVIALAIE